MPLIYPNVMIISCRTILSLLVVAGQEGSLNRRTSALGTDPVSMIACTYLALCNSISQRHTSHSAIFDHALIRTMVMHHPRGNERNGSTTSASIPGSCSSCQYLAHSKAFFIQKIDFYEHSVGFGFPGAREASDPSLEFSGGYEGGRL